ncbi:MAG: T9SS type A sorting domain-containing protein [Bacteroidales bacterium]|nr:T9SS type A sorting domain-containing protein [Bacteroidales bacterium]
MKFLVVYFCMVCLIFCENQISGQTLTEANLPVNGDYIHLVNCNVSGVSPGFSGQNVIWDFSGLTTQPNPNYDDYFIRFRDPSVTPYFDQFPESEICITSWDSTWAYYVTTESTLERVGVSLDIPILGRSLITYADLETENEYPFTFPMSFADDFSANLSATLLSDSLHGFKTVMADSYGTLKLPYATFHNVLRLVETNTQVLDLGIINNRKYFRWYSPAYKFWLLQLSYEDNFLKTVLYADNPIPAGLNENRGKIELLIYPNPADDHVRLDINGLHAGNCNVSVFDLFSKKMINIRNSVSVSEPVVYMDVSDLAAGLYIVSVCYGRYEFHSKLLIQR